MKQFAALALAGACAFALLSASRDSQPDKRLDHSFRLPETGGWITVHLEGNPATIGYQHGYLLAPEIADLRKVTELNLTHDSGKDYAFFRKAAETMLWPHVEKEYREELQGIVEGARAHGVKIDLWDVVAMNAVLELSPYYTHWYDKQHKKPAAKQSPGEHCSAFVATGSYTRDGKPVIAHNNWTGYLEGSRWNIVFDITPASGRHFVMDGLPGVIHSGDDFGINDAGIMITETTISQFSGFDPNATPEFVRARKAMQYAASIDDFARIMKTGNNGGYANNWLVADRKTGEIADLELGLKNVNLRRTKDGYFAGTNFPVSEKLRREETGFDANDRSVSANARRIRAEQLLESAKGSIDVEFAHRYLSDHFDSFTGKDDPDERTLCGHIDLSPRGIRDWQPPYGTAGTVQAKAADSPMASKLAFSASMGHACGRDFKAGAHIAAHPEFGWEKDLLRDLDSHAWTMVPAAR